ncbi:hypothetical protein SAMCFNEI73_Ch0946 [Sinorhizobium americanum]|uniref:Uncharacterized protein n=1 Tax=Sinorhizobium americanum TaxID=194963 RepID=A0A1L3LJK6_9HYPH|nr:hypothetical protein SAMCCGM7_Ch0942 [Sinorhizobium americanum CCGM7]APG90268.1 hypothetical protein SAMCFNEI73_Ch0946 [Sinorhizobium americanum]
MYLARERVGMSPIIVSASKNVGARQRFLGLRSALASLTGLPCKT